MITHMMHPQALSTTVWSRPIVINLAWPTAHNLLVLYADDTSAFQAIAEMGYQQMTEVQARTIPQLLTGRDVLGAAKTGNSHSCNMVWLCILKWFFRRRNALFRFALQYLLQNLLTCARCYKCYTQLFKKW